VREMVALMDWIPVNPEARAKVLFEAEGLGRSGERDGDEEKKRKEEEEEDMHYAKQEK